MKKTGEVPYNNTSEYGMKLLAGEIKNGDSIEAYEKRNGIVSFDNHEDAKEYFAEKGIDIDEVNK